MACSKLAALSHDGVNWLSPKLDAMEDERGVGDPHTLNLNRVHISV